MRGEDRVVQGRLSQEAVTWTQTPGDGAYMKVGEGGGGRGTDSRAASEQRRQTYSSG